MALRCGNKSAHGGQTGEHDTVEQVRACYAKRYGIEQVASDVSEATDALLGSRRVQKAMWPATDKQIAYALGLQDERLLPDNWLIYSEEDLRSKERDEVSGIITLLKALPRGNDGRTSSRWSMPEGRYALYIPGPDDTPGAYSYVDRQDLVKPSYGEWWFFQVDKPTEGRWAGYTFIKRLIGAPGDYKQVEMQRSVREQILDEIDKDPKTAMVNYGLQTQVCGRCGSALTVKESRERGLGPKCASKDGWF